MQLVNVNTISRSAFRQPLTYFSAKPVSVGDIVLVSFRNKPTYAIATSVRPLSEEKASIKAGTIALKRIQKVIPHSLSKGFLKAAGDTADFFATNIGAVIDAVTPSDFLQAIITGKHARAAKSGGGREILQSYDAERSIQYRSLTREAFRKNESIFIVVPTILDVEKTATTLSRGIEEYTVTLHSDLTKKTLKKNIERIFSDTHPLLIVATSGYLACIPPDTATIIVEHESSRSYKQMVSPFVDVRFFIAELSKESNRRLILGDSMLSLETLEQYRAAKFQALSTVVMRPASKGKFQVIDMRRYKPNLRGNLEILSTELQELIEEIRKTSGRMFIYVARKGLAPVTMCGDCGEVLLCQHCHNPLVLHKSTDHRRFFLCHQCGTRFDSHTRCKQCNSWKLLPYGIGTEFVDETLKEKFPGLRIFHASGDSIRGRTDAKKIVDDFYQTPASVLIGTELALPYLKDSIDASAIVSMDSLFALSDFRINERIMHTLLRLRERSRTQCLLQTRQPDHVVISLAKDSSIDGFYEYELGIRKALHFPPYSVLVKISLSGEKAFIEREMKNIAASIQPYELKVLSTYVKKAGERGLSGIFKVPAQRWPDKQVVALLRSLPPAFEVAVDPEHVL